MKQATPTNWCEAIEDSLCDRFAVEGCCMIYCLHEWSDTFLCLAKAQGMENITSTSSCDAPMCSTEQTAQQHDEEDVTEGDVEEVDPQIPITCHSSCVTCDRSNDWTRCFTCADEDVELVLLNPEDPYRRIGYCPREGSCRSEFVVFEHCIKNDTIDEECAETCDVFFPRDIDDEDICDSLSAAFCSYPECDCPYCH